MQTNARFAEHVTACPECDAEIGEPCEGPGDEGAIEMLRYPCEARRRKAGALTFGPMELHEIGEAVSEALPEPHPNTVKCEDGVFRTALVMAPCTDGRLADRLIAALDRRGWRLVREGER